MFVRPNNRPVFQKSKEKMISFDFSNRNLSLKVGEFYNCEIVHPIPNGNKIQFTYLFIPNKIEDGYVAFKPIMNKSGKTVRIVYEIGGNFDNEQAALALLHLLTTILILSHPLTFEIPEHEDIVSRFESFVKRQLQKTSYCTFDLICRPAPPYFTMFELSV